MATPTSTKSDAGSDDSGRDQPPNKRKLNNETSCVDVEVGEEATDQQPQSKKPRKQTKVKEQTTSTADTAVTCRAVTQDRDSSSSEKSSYSNRPVPAVTDATVADRTQHETAKFNGSPAARTAATAVTKPSTSSVAGSNTLSNSLPPSSPQRTSAAAAAAAAAAAVSKSSAGSDQKVTAADCRRIIEGMRQDRDREAEALIWTGLPLAIERIQVYLLGGAFNPATFTQLQQQDECKHQQERQKLQEIAIRELQRALADLENSSSAPIEDDNDDDDLDNSEAGELEDEEEEEEEVEAETESDVNNKGDEEIVDNAVSSESAVYKLTTDIQNSVKRLLQDLSEHSTRLREWVRLHVPQSMYGYNIGQAARDQAIAIVDEAEHFATIWLTEINSYQLRRAELQRSANKLSNVIDQRRLVNEFDEYQFGILQRTVVKARSMYSGLYHSFSVNYDQLQSFQADARPPIGFS